VTDHKKAAAASRRIILLAALAPALLIAVLTVYRLPIFAQLENRVYDTLLRSAATTPPAGRISIVDVDERSLSAIGQWPWRRDVIGRLIGRIRDLGAAVVALDVVFAEQDRYEPRGGKTPDRALADALRAGGVVVGYALTFDSRETQPTSCVLHPLGAALVQPRGGGEPPLFHASGVICSLPELAQAAGSSGFLNAAPDADGILRRAPLLIEYGGRVYPGLALAAVMGATGTRSVALRTANVNTTSLILDSRSVPLDGRSNLLLRYRGKKRTFPYVSASDVLRGLVPADTFRQKLVFVGATALGTREVVSTPLDTLFAGVEVQATVADNLLRRDFIRRPEHATTLETTTVIVAGVLVASLAVTTGLLGAALAAAACVAASWYGAQWLFGMKGQFISPLYPIIGLTLTLISATVAKLTQERGRAEREAHDKILAQRLMVQSLLSLTEVRDAETGKHSRRTQRYARLLAHQLAAHPRYHDYLTPERIELLSSLAPLHDIGKVGVPDQLLNKPGKLTGEEYMEMRRHPTYGLDVIKNAERQAGANDDLILMMAKDIVYTHHEWWNGTGYPQGLKGEQIPIAGRLMALVDVYDALISNRIYRQAIPHDKAVEFIKNASGTQFDPAVVEAFERVAAAMKGAAAEVGDPPTR
jgi:CHASE2 domain-containing sensor protein